MEKNKCIAYCGLDCEHCEARIATINNDDSLREKVAKEWSELNKVNITKEMINCEGCKLDGKKFYFCEHLCPIRQCNLSHGYETCHECDELTTCQKIRMIIGDNKDALCRLLKGRVLINSEKLSITYLDTSMYHDVWQNSLDENNRRFVPDEVFETLEDATEVVNQLIECYLNENGPYIYPVIRNSDNANLGYVQLVRIEEGWEIGYHIAQKYCGNGYASEAVSLFLQYLRDKKELKEIYGVALADNKASRRVLEKNGFELIFEGEGIYQGRPDRIIKTIKKL